MDPLKSPRQDGKYRDRDIDCQEALQKAFLEVVRLNSTGVVDAAGGRMSPQMQALAKRAESAGWSLEEAEVAISELAQNVLDEDAEQTSGL
jgi:phage tail tape-measure protein